MQEYGAIALFASAFCFTLVLVALSNFVPPRDLRVLFAFILLASTPFLASELIITVTTRYVGTTNVID
jgi:hypothetical protein